MSHQYNEHRKEFEAAFEHLPRIDDSNEEFVSPSGLYKLYVTLYGKAETHRVYARGIVSKIANGEIIADIKRNYPDLWHSWIEHPNGNEYLLCGEDYQGYSVVNLTQETYQAYFPNEANQDVGFCWVAVFPSPDKLMLAVDGCIWACPYELVFYDFQQPDKFPYKELGRISNLTDSEGWLDNETFVLSREVEIRKSDKVPCEQLSEKEQEILDTDSSLVDYRVEKINARRPLMESAV